MWDARHLTVEQVEGFIFLDLSSLIINTLRTVRTNVASDRWSFWRWSNKRYPLNENTIFAKSL